MAVPALRVLTPISAFAWPAQPQPADVASQTAEQLLEVFALTQLLEKATCVSCADI